MSQNSTPPIASNQPNRKSSLGMSRTDHVDHARKDLQEGLDVVERATPLFASLLQFPFDMDKIMSFQEAWAKAKTTFERRYPHDGHVSSIGDILSVVTPQLGEAANQLYADMRRALSWLSVLRWVPHDRPPEEADEPLRVRESIIISHLSDYQRLHRFLRNGRRGLRRIRWNLLGHIVLADLRLMAERVKLELSANGETTRNTEPSPEEPGTVPVRLRGTELILHGKAHKLSVETIAVLNALGNAGEPLELKELVAVSRVTRPDRVLQRLATDFPELDVRAWSTHRRLGYFANVIFDS